MSQIATAQIAERSPRTLFPVCLVCPWCLSCPVTSVHHSRNDLVASFTSNLHWGGKTAATRTMKLVPVATRYQRAQKPKKATKSRKNVSNPGVLDQLATKATDVKTTPSSRQAKADKAALAAMNNANPEQQMTPGGLYILPSMVLSATPSGVHRSPSGAIAVLHAEAATTAEVCAFQAAGDKRQHLATNKPATFAAAQAVLSTTGVTSVWVALASGGKADDVVICCIDHDPVFAEANIRAASAAKWIVDAVECWSPTRMSAVLNGEHWTRLRPSTVAKCLLANFTLADVHSNKVHFDDAPSDKWTFGLMNFADMCFDKVHLSTTTHFTVGSSARSTAQ